MGSLSPSSSDSQATGRSHAATHALTSVVLPKPAGAEMSVSLRCSPAFSRSIRRERRTTFGRGGGIYSFVARIGVDIDQVYGLRQAKADNGTMVKQGDVCGLESTNHIRCVMLVLIAEPFDGAFQFRGQGTCLAPGGVDLLPQIGLARISVGSSCQEWQHLTLLPIALPAAVEHQRA